MAVQLVGGKAEGLFVPHSRACYDLVFPFLYLFAGLLYGCDTTLSGQLKSINLGLSGRRCQQRVELVGEGKARGKFQLCYLTKNILLTSLFQWCHA